MSHEKRGTAIQISLNADDSIFRSFSGKFRGVFEMFRYFDFGLQELIPMCECKDIGIVVSELKDMPEKFGIPTHAGGV